MYADPPVFVAQTATSIITKKRHIENDQRSVKMVFLWVSLFQVCDWIYPLMCSQSPVLSCSTGVYMFPDVMSQVPGSYVGVVLSAELPAAVREMFDDLLKQMSDLRVQVNASVSSLSARTV